MTDGEAFNLEQARRLAESARAALGPRIEAMNQAIQQSVAPMLEAQRQAIERSVAPVVQAHADAINAWAAVNREVIDSLLRSAELIREAWREAIPENIRELHGDSFYKALKMSIENGPCVIWAPRTEIIEHLVLADTFAERAAVLVEYRDDVLSDMAAVLAESEFEVVAAQGDAHELAILAVEAARDGYDAPAQALAAATLACVLQEVLRYAGLGAVYKDMSVHDIEAADFWVLRRVTIELATSRTLIDTDRYAEGFNRHGTLHGKRSFYGPGQMLAGLLLVVAWIRELSWLAENEPSFLVDVAE